jgi:hypothetical protein
MDAWTACRKTFQRPRPISTTAILQTKRTRPAAPANIISIISRRRASSGGDGCLGWLMSSPAPAQACMWEQTAPGDKREHTHTPPHTATQHYWRNSSRRMLHPTVKEQASCRENQGEGNAHAKCSFRRACYIIPDASAKIIIRLDHQNRGIDARKDRWSFRGKAGRVAGRVGDVPGITARNSNRMRGGRKEPTARRRHLQAGSSAAGCR